MCLFACVNVDSNVVSGHGSVWRSQNAERFGTVLVIHQNVDLIVVVMLDQSFNKIRFVSNKIAKLK